MFDGQVLQGIGESDPWVATVAMICDHYEGRATARITTFIMIVFITLPIIAPLLGQEIMF